MLAKILDWVFGKAPTEDRPDTNAVPYKVEPPAATVEAAAASKPSVVETAPITVKAKYKKTELNKMSKKELLNLANTHGLEIKARITKDELVKLLSKV